jgi:glycine cleavage system protein P-like pyridoxal-binding family
MKFMSARMIPTYELTVPGRHGIDLPAPDVPQAPLPDAELRADCGLPELSQLDVVRHYLALSQRNFGVDSGFYPLGSWRPGPARRAALCHRDAAEVDRPDGAVLRQFRHAGARLAYIRRHGAAGLRANSEYAVLNANYLRVTLRDAFGVPFDRVNMHEFVCRGAIDGTGVRALDVAKRLLDYGFHPPTNYFPLIVPEALMIEPTETESKPTLDAFVAAMREIVEEARTSPERVKSAPHETPVGRLDEVKAARELVLSDRTKPSGG